MHVRVETAIGQDTFKNMGTFDATFQHQLQKNLAFLPVAARFAVLVSAQGVSLKIG